MSPLAPAIGFLAVLAASASDGAAYELRALVQTVEDPASAAAPTRIAVQELGNRQEARAVPALIRLLFQPRQGRTLEAEAAFALFQIGRPSSDALLRILRSKDPQLLAWGATNHVPETWLLAGAAGLLADIGDPRAQAPLLTLLHYENADKQVELAIRREAAKALGRLHTKAAILPIAAMVTTPNLQARHEFVHALIAIGGREALPALARAAGEGEWDVRKVAMDGFTMLGDDREQVAYQKILQREEDVISSDCWAHPHYQGCGDEKVLLDKMLAGIRSFGKRLEAASQCRQDSTCWTERLKDPNPGVRGRAVWELARQRSGKRLDALFVAVGDADAAVRGNALQCLEWLSANDPVSARAQGGKQVSALEARLVQGQGTVAGARFEAPLRRLIHRIRGAQSSRWVARRR